MPKRQPVAEFVGGSNRLIAPTVSNQASINWFPETPKEGGKADRYLRYAEGLRSFAQFESIGTSAFLYDGQRAFACCGTIFGEILENGTTLVKGTIADQGILGRAYLVDNGTEFGRGLSPANQVCICSGGYVYIYDKVTDVFTGPIDFDGQLASMVEFLDGYFLVLMGNSRIVRYSELLNGLVWPTDSVFSTNWSSDNISFMRRCGRFLWLVGTKTGSIWADNGDPDLPFAPVQGVFLNQGCIAPHSHERDGDDGLIWLNQSEHGGGVVVRASNDKPQDVSTYAINLKIAAQQGRNDHIGTIGHATAMMHNLQGHRFYWLGGITNMDTTPVYDIVEQEWHERAMWDPQAGVWERHLARAHTWAFERHFVGVRDSGIIYALDTDQYDDGVV